MITTIENVTIEQIVSLCGLVTVEGTLEDDCLRALDPRVGDRVEFGEGEDHAGKIVSIKGNVKGGWYVEVVWESLVKTSQYWEVVPTDAAHE